MVSTRETDIASVPSGGFPKTDWSVVLSAGRGSLPNAQAALERLGHAFWYPLYAYVRRQGRSVQEAQDLTQEFFARLLEKGCLRHPNPARGPFRSFLLTALKRFLVNDWEKGSPPYAGVAAELGLTEAALKVAVHRLREHYRELLRAEVAHTVARPAEVDDELRHLIAVISC